MAGRYRAYWRTLPTAVSALAAADFRSNFRRQGVRTSKSAVDKWKPRQGGKDPGRALLISSGRLRRGIRPAPLGSVARVINTVPYAAIHNRGGSMRGQMRAASTNLRTRLQRLRRSGHAAQMPARPFMVTTDPLIDEVRAHIMEGLNKVFNVPSS